MYNECRHIKSDGKRCRAAALNGKPYCFFHIKSDHLHRRITAEIPPIEDSTSILLAIGQVVRALDSETMDCKRAGLMLYGLQIASSVTTRLEKAQPADTVPDTVRSIHNADGEPVEFTEAFFSGAPMLAPENSVCEPPHDCANCNRKDSCDNPHADVERAPGDALDAAYRDPNSTLEERRKLVFAYVDYLDSKPKKEDHTPPPIPEPLTIHADAGCPMSPDFGDMGETPRQHLAGAPSKLCLGGNEQRAPSNTACPMSPGFGDMGETPRQHLPGAPSKLCLGGNEQRAPSNTAWQVAHLKGLCPVHRVVCDERECQS